MRIQHNIAALSAYRNLTNNNSMVSKNLEKLSSGYRINRAGDDAAGLAISEKMRAQITGLETAQKNASDGISLIQTAEGALTEVHSMLNRMVELANQSANGTYNDEEDRPSLQAEVDALLEEIDRISKSTNFNGLKLLNGDLGEKTIAAEDAVTGLKDVSASITHLADGVKPNEPVKGKFTLDLSSLEMRNDGVKAEIKGPDDAAITAAEGAAGSKASISFELDGMEVKLPKDATTGSIAIKIGDKDFTIDQTADADSDGTITAAEIATALAAGGHKITVKDDNGNDVDLTIAKVGTTGIKFEAAANGITVGVEDAFNGKNITIEDKGNDAAVTATIKFGNNKLGDVTINKGSKMTGAEWATAYMNTLTGSKTTIDGIEYNVSNKDGKLTFEMTQDPKKDFTTDLTASLEVTDSTGNDVYAKAGNDAVSKDNAVAKDNDAGVFINQGNGIGVHMDTTPVKGGDRVLAQGTLDLTNIVKDGAALKIGNETYVFAVGKDSKFKDMANVVDLTDYETVDAATLKAASHKLSNVAAGNKMFDVSTDNVNGTIRLTERKDSGIDYSINKLNGATDANLKDADNTAWKDLVQVGTANASPKAASSSGGLTLQIGDTSDDFNQMTVYVDDMSSKGLGIDQINIKDQKGAAEAVDTIKKAINTVSTQRGKLGALQNRLEHTINNLSVTTENITAAESRIRDVDMAEEMMAYTKNNILVQASQAMLAQANQIPQGVLQLLQ